MPSGHRTEPGAHTPTAQVSANMAQAPGEVLLAAHGLRPIGHVLDAAGDTMQLTAPGSGLAVVAPEVFVKQRPPGYKVKAEHRGCERQAATHELTSLLFTKKYPMSKPVNAVSVCTLHCCATAASAVAAATNDRNMFAMCQGVQTTSPRL